MFWMLNWILACPILVWTEANVFSSDLGDTNANALEQITMETAVKKVKFEAGCKFWDRNLVWHYFHIFLLQNVRQDWVPTLLECPKNHQIFHLIVWLFENCLKCKKVETLYCEKKVVFLFVKNAVKNNTDWTPYLHGLSGSAIGISTTLLILGFVILILFCIFKNTLCGI